MAKPLSALIVVLDFLGVSIDEFNAWYDTEHLPERLKVPGFLSAQRWLSADGKPLSVASYDLSGLDVLTSDPYQAIAGQNFSPWSKRIIGACRRMWRYEAEQTLPGDQLSPDGAGGLLLLAMNVGSSVEDEFNRWYNTEHIPQLLAVHGVLAARRFRSTQGDHKYLAAYHVRSPAVVGSEAWVKAVDTRWTESICPRIHDRMEILCAAYRGA